MNAFAREAQAPLADETSEAEPVLTVAVPTYNRRLHLQQCVESIVVSASRCATRIELLISDNASSDDTRDYLDELTKHHDFVRVILQPVNIGAERNFRSLAEAAAGRFIWVIGDDDLIEPSAVEDVMRQIHNGASCVVCNHSTWDRELMHLVAARGLHVQGDRWMTSKDMVMRVFGLNLGYISSVVMNRRLFLTLDDAEYEAFTSYGFPFMYAAFVGLGVECKLAYVSTPVVVNRAGNSGGYDWYRYFVRGSCLIFDRLVEDFGYSRRSVNIAKSRTIHQYVVRKLAARRLDCEDFKGIPALLFKSYWFLPSFWLVLVPIIVMPRRVIFLARDLFKRLR